LKIIHLVGWYFPESVGGSEVYVAGLASRQKSGGDVVSIAAPLAGASGATQYDYDGVDCFRYSIPKNATRDEAQGRVEVRGTSSLREHFEREKPDVAHFHTITTGLGLDEMRAARKSGARVVFTSHLPALGSLCQRGTLMRWGDSLCDGHATPVKCAACMLQQRGLSKPAAWTMGWLGSLPGAASVASGGRIGTAVQMTDFVRFRLHLQNEILAIVDRFVLLNQWAFDVMLANGARPEKLALNYLGHSATHVVRKPTPDIRPTESPMLIGYVGRLADGKGVDRMLSAIEMLPNDTAINFEFRGAINDAAAMTIAERIQSVAAKRPNVKLEPAVAPDEIMDVIRGYDLLCVPSVAYENGPTVVSEAHAVGTPVLGTAIGAMPELIDSGVNGLLVKPGDARALSEAFTAVARDPTRTIDAWRTHLPDSRSMMEIARDYETLYRELISGKRSAGTAS